MAKVLLKGCPDSSLNKDTGINLRVQVYPVPIQMEKQLEIATIPMREQDVTDTLVSQSRKLSGDVAFPKAGSFMCPQHGSIKRHTSFITMSFPGMMSLTQFISLSLGKNEVRFNGSDRINK